MLYRFGISQDGVIYIAESPEGISKREVLIYDEEEHVWLPCFEEVLGIQKTNMYFDTVSSIDITQLTRPLSDRNISANNTDFIIIKFQAQELKSYNLAPSAISSPETIHIYKNLMSVFFDYPSSVDFIHATE